MLALISYLTNIIYSVFPCSDLFIFQSYLQNLKDYQGRIAELLQEYATDAITKFELVQQFQSVGVKRSQVAIAELETEINQNIIRYYGGMLSYVNRRITKNA